MKAMTSNEKPKVWVNGKLVSLEELQEEYKSISVATAPTNIRIMEYLADAKKPLTRQDIAKHLKMTTGYTAGMLKKLVKNGFDLLFDMERSNYKYYLLTEKGFNLLQGHREQAT